MKGSEPTRAKRYLWHGGILLKDDLPIITLQPPKFTPAELFDEKRIIAVVIWQEIENYFKIRNCIAHHNGLIQRMRYPHKLIKYASGKGILTGNKDQKELSLTQEFNKEVCDTMMKFFSKLSGAYYGTPLPEYE